MMESMAALEMEKLTITPSPSKPHHEPTKTHCDAKNHDVAKPHCDAKKRAVRNEKPRWTEPDTGYSLTAGGILFYDDDGIWVISEREGKGVNYTDIGGKYMFEDGDIYAAIKRELAEETYQTVELTYANMTELRRSNKVARIYVKGHLDVPVYLCLLVPIEVINVIVPSFKLDPKEFTIRRNVVVQQNPTYSDHYVAQNLHYISYNDVASLKMSYRLRLIIKHSHLASRVPRLCRGQSPECEDT